MSVASDLSRALSPRTRRTYVPREGLPFVVIFLPRTGSNLLAAMLDSHPEIVCHHELFNPAEIHRSLSYKDTPLSFGTVEERDSDPYEFIRRVFAFSEGQRAIGFKIAPGQNNPVLLSLLLNRRVRKVLMERRNWLQAYTSSAIAQQTQVWSVRKDEGTTARSDRPKVTVDIGDLRRFARKRRWFGRLVRALLVATGQRFEAVDYEDVGDPATVRRLLAFLEVDPTHQLEVRTVKQNAARLEDRIENYVELRKALAGTSLAQCLD